MSEYAIFKRTIDDIAADYCVVKSQISRALNWVDGVFVKINGKVLHMDDDIYAKIVANIKSAPVE